MNTPTTTHPTPPAEAEAHAGELTAQGTLFMRSTIYPQRTSTGAVQYMLPLLERRGAGVLRLTATWVGPAADEFYKTHGLNIKAGTALDCTFSRIYCHNNELHAVVKTCHPAAARWADKPAAETHCKPMPHPARSPRDEAEAIACSADERQ